ncbi:MAG: glycosyltransferase [Promethearchaeota archaeon]
MNDEIIKYIKMPQIPKIRFFFFFIGILNILIKAVFVTKPDIIMIDYTVNLLFFPFLLSTRWFNRKTKIIMDIRTLPVNLKSFKWNIKIFFFSLFMAKFTCDGITFISPFMREYCTKRIKLPNKKISIWSSGVNEKIFDPKKYQKEKTNNDFEIFYHGGISISRGIGSLIKAVKLLRNKVDSVSLKLIGNVVDGKKIKQIIRENKLDNICKIYAPVAYEAIPQVINNCDLPVIPLPDFIGWRVSSPIKLLEYMAMEKTMVLTDIEAHRDVVNGYNFAFFAESSEPTELAKAIEKAYKRKNDFLKLGKKAREIVLNKYTWELQADKLMNFMESL